MNTIITTLRILWWIGITLMALPLAAPLYLAMFMARHLMASRTLFNTLCNYKHRIAPPPPYWPKHTRRKAL